MLPEGLMNLIPGRVAELERRVDALGNSLGQIYIDNSTFIKGIHLGKIILFDQTYNTVTMYPKLEHDTATSTDFDKALSESTSGDIILLSAITIGGAHAMVAGVRVVGRSRYGTILTGQITGASGASIENLSIIQSADSASNLVGVDSPAAGTFYINDCDIEITQAGSGNAYGLSVDIAGTTIEVWDSYLYGDSGSGSGYGAYHSDGSCYIYGGRAYGSTATFNV